MSSGFSADTDMLDLHTCQYYLFHLPLKKVRNSHWDVLLWSDMQTEQTDAFTNSLTLSCLRGQRGDMCELFLLQVPQYAGR